MQMIILSRAFAYEILSMCLVEEMDFQAFPLCKCRLREVSVSSGEDDPEAFIFHRNKSEGNPALDWENCMFLDLVVIAAVKNLKLLTAGDLLQNNAIQFLPRQ